MKIRKHTKAVVIATASFFLAGAVYFGLDKYNRDIDNLEQEIAKVQEQNEALEVKNIELSGESKEQLQTLEEQEVIIEEIKKEIKSKEEQIKEKNSIIQEKQKTIEQKENEVQKLKEDLAAKKETELVANQTKTTEKKQTLVASNVSRSSSEIKAEGKTFYVSATAYTAFCNGCSGVTATGINLRANPHLKVIAVDPSVIPLGSKVHVEGYGYAIAGDTGGAIKGNKIDLFMQNHSDAIAFGRKQVKITVIGK